MKMNMDRQRQRIPFKCLLSMLLMGTFLCACGSEYDFELVQGDGFSQAGVHKGWGSVEKAGAKATRRSKAKRPLRVRIYVGPVCAPDLESDAEKVLVVFCPAGENTDIACCQDGPLMDGYSCQTGDTGDTCASGCDTDGVCSDGSQQWDCKCNTSGSATATY